MTFYDDSPVMAVEAELIHAFQLRGITLAHADQMELWELAAACGVHRVETWEERNDREIVTKKEEYWQETQEKRQAMMRARAERKAEARRGKKVS